jgi:hypothetical protein
MNTTAGAFVAVHPVTLTPPLDVYAARPGRSYGLLVGGIAMLVGGALLGAGGFILTAKGSLGEGSRCDACVGGGVTMMVAGGLTHLAGIPVTIVGGFKASRSASAPSRPAPAVAVGPAGGSVRWTF